MTDVPELEPPDFSDLREVHLRQVPVALWARTQEHTDELIREFALIASDPGVSGSVPARLTELVEQLNAMYAGVSSDQEAQLFAAAEAGVPSLDLDFTMPAAAADAAVALGRLLDEADEFCLAGRHLLTLTTPPDLVRFRRWYLDQFVTQVAGSPPVAWPDVH